MTVRMFKYPIPVDGHPVDMTLQDSPFDECASLAGRVHIGWDGIDAGTLYLWAPHHDDGPEHTHRLVVVGTGHRWPDWAVRIATVQLLPTFPLVWHVLEVRPDD